jgi:hypothetical protein
MQRKWQNRPGRNLKRDSRSDSRNKVFGQSRFFWVVPLALSCVMAVPPVFGQTDTARIQGSVMDPSGAAIPGATIAVRNTDTNATVTVTSDSSGNFAVPALPRGNYEATVTDQGFTTQVQELTLTVS